MASHDSLRGKKVEQWYVCLELTERKRLIVCGIAGFSFGPKYNPPPMVRQVLMSWLAVAMDNRGGDSFGYSKLTPGGKLKTWKQTGLASGQLRLGDVATTQLLMFHTRKKTHGAVNIYNAHPIQQGHILGCHNGIVSNHSELNKKYDRDFELDSRHIFEHLAKGISVADIGVYGAISYIDLNQPKVLNLCRLSAGGDLEVVGIGTGIEDVKGIVYASTLAPIKGALISLGVPYFKYEMPPKVSHYVQDGRLLIGKTLPFGEKAWAYQKETSQMTGISYEPPSDFSPCKGCRKKIRKAKGNFLPYTKSGLCPSCLTEYRKKKYGVLENKGGVTNEDKTPSGSDLAAGKVCHCGDRGITKKGEDWYCSECYRREFAITVPIKDDSKYPEIQPSCKVDHHTAVTFKGVTGCLTCKLREKNEENRKTYTQSLETPESEYPAIKPKCRLLKHTLYQGHGCLTCKLERDKKAREELSKKALNYFEQMERANGRLSRGAYNLQPFDPCTWCASMIREAKNKKGDKWRLQPDRDLCPGCADKWQGLLKDVKMMTAAEKQNIALCLYCSKCGVPVFGRKRPTPKEIQVMLCHSCEGTCVNCGSPVSFSAVVGGMVQMPCRECQPDRYSRAGGDAAAIPFVTKGAGVLH